jgi:glycosyltransferase involved in cell wall biosynthesis
VVFVVVLPLHYGAQVNILVVHEVSYRRKVVYEYQDFAERLAGRGHTVSVIDYDAEQDHEYKSETISRTGEGNVQLENTPYTNLPLYKYFSGRRNFTKLLDKKLRAGTVDVVFLYSVFVTGTPTVRLCRRYKVPVVYRVLDAYHRLAKNPLMRAPLYLGERYIYRNADSVCLTNEKMRSYVEKVAGQTLPQVSVIHHGVDTKHFRPLPADAGVREKYGIKPDDFVVTLLGTTYAFANLDKVILGWKRFTERLPNLKLMIIGGGEMDSALQAAVAESGLHDRVILTGFQNYPKLPGLLSVAKLAINPFSVTDITRDIIPIKVLQYLSSGLPCVCGVLPDVIRLFPETDSGMVYHSADDMPGFLDKISEVASNPARLKALRDAGLNHIEKSFSMTACIQKTEQALETAKARK